MLSSGQAKRALSGSELCGLFLIDGSRMGGVQCEKKDSIVQEGDASEEIEIRVARDNEVNRT